MNDLAFPAITYRFADVPAPGRAIDVAPGIKWLRMPLPFALNHINLWLLEDGHGWTIVDCGYGVAQTEALWQEHFAHTLGGKPVVRVIATHCHPDHVGCAAFLTEHWQAPLWMTESEFLTAHAFRDSAAGYTRDNYRALWQAHGLDEARLAAQDKRTGSYARGVPRLPLHYRRMLHDDVIHIGAHEWRVIVGYGHAPEHATLYCEALGVLISGDQVLPRITTNIGVWANQPDGDPLGLFMHSWKRFEALPENTFVLPSHDKPFHGLHARIATLREHHQHRLHDVEHACAEPRRAAELLPVLFKRELDDHQLMFAMGETIAHLNYLWHARRLDRMIEGGHIRFVRVAL